MIKHFDHQHSTVQEVRECGGTAWVETRTLSDQEWGPELDLTADVEQDDWNWAQEVAAHEAALAAVAPGGIVSPNPRKPFSMGYAYSEALHAAARDGDQARQVWLQDVADGEATWEEYADARTDLPEETRQQIKQAAESKPVVHTPTWKSARGSSSGPTQKQIDYLLSLASQKGVEVDPENFDKYSISKEIDRLKKLPKPVVQPQTEAAAQYVTQDGIYRNPATGEIFKVQWNRASGSGRSLYAKQLRITEGDWPGAGNSFEVYEIPLDHAIDGQLDWTYVPGLLRKIDPAWRMTAEDSTKFGALYGICVRCSRDLTDEVSIDRGMGPVCAGKQFG